MLTKITLRLAATAIFALTTAAQAGQPDNPHARRDLVQANKQVQQDLNGPSGFGQRMSLKATTRSDADPYRNFGDYLKRKTQ